MKYIINNSVVFDVNSRTLSIQGDSERSIDLPAPSGRLLSEFIRVKGQLVTRDHLLKHVWEDYGFVVSSANLNNHISVLRRSFISLDQTGAIINTIPKLGFQFDAEVQAILSEKSLEDQKTDNDTDTRMQTVLVNPTTLPTEHSDKIEPVALPDAMSDTVLATEHEEDIKPDISSGISSGSNSINKNQSTLLLNKTIPKSIVFLSLTLLIVSLCIVGITYTNMNNIAMGRFSPELLYTEGKCNIYSLDSHINSSNKAFINEARDLLKPQVTDCSGEAFDLFFQNDEGNDVRGQVYLVSKCKRESNSSYSHCANFRFLEGV
ncbi:winged helix-turn-helix domain-containing protein [Serratia fonticola]|uniref:winged helix-turn-helix domain-containing protein n=1 Tax=Serratia fonticola TaxID=47917 RepID=UPI001C4468F8|nr:winged helix-turn-helix domain-containing protein [Serratia fonticola]QXN64756.1 winged helix-turn-helix domain-containing protein [Serratia fonticola]